jgi:prepilin-type processing-associated H-X9-DG protein
LDAEENPEWMMPPGKSLDYGFNMATAQGRLQMDMPRPAKIIMLGDHGGGAAYIGNCGNYSGCPYNMTVAGVRHISDTQANAGFCDGHAESLLKNEYLDNTAATGHWYW